MADMGLSLLLDAYPLASATPERLAAAWLVKALSIPGLITSPLPQNDEMLLIGTAPTMTTTAFCSKFRVEYARKETKVKTEWARGANLRGKSWKLA
jgi:hypothetical protein